MRTRELNEVWELLVGFSCPHASSPTLVTVLHIVHPGLENIPWPRVVMVSGALLCNPPCASSSSRTSGTGFELIREEPVSPPWDWQPSLLLGISASSWPQWEVALDSWWKAHGYWSQTALDWIMRFTFIARCYLLICTEVMAASSQVVVRLWAT